jgi:hypothetical protein
LDPESDLPGGVPDQEEGLPSVTCRLFGHLAFLIVFDNKLTLLV